MFVAYLFNRVLLGLVWKTDDILGHFFYSILKIVGQLLKNIEYMTKKQLGEFLPNANDYITYLAISIFFK